MNTGSAFTINPDDFLETPEGRVWTPERNAEAWAQSYQALKQALARYPRILRIILVCGIQGSGKTTWITAQPDRTDVIYFDAALPGTRHRKGIIEIAKERGVPIDAVWIKVPLATALDRNSQRDPDKRVSDAAIQSVANQFEEPTEAEGFGQVLIVEDRPSAT